MSVHKRKGRGTFSSPPNRFLGQHTAAVHMEGIDEEEFEETPPTIVRYDHPKKIVNKVDSPDVGMMYSANPYHDANMDAPIAMPGIPMNSGG
ncbi:MAG: hypothetical protein P8X57_09275 [Cyclobacteriaceae bacterium]